MLASAFLVVLMALGNVWTPKLGLDLRGGTTITLTASNTTGQGSVDPASLELARTIIQQRVDSIGVGETEVTTSGDRQIVVAVPNVQQDELVRMVGQTAQLYFRLVYAQEQVAAPEPARREISVLVRAEDGIPVDPAAFAKQVMEILNDPRGWGPVDGVTFSRTDVDAEADIVLTLASPATTEVLCGELPTNGYTSCGRGRPVNINGDRWVEGAAAFMAAGGTIDEYRTYVINHEIGHSLSHPHERCPAPGQPAPVMLQQTLTVGSCTPNGWPNP